MSKPFRLGIVGAGQIALQSHLPAALASREVELVALVDPVVDRARSICLEFGIEPRVAADVAEVLDEVDGVVIASPNHTHRDLGVRCAERGVHVLIEKPLTNSVEEGEEILRTAEDHGVTVAVGFSHTPRNEVALFKSLLDSNYFGTPRRFIYQTGTVGGWAPLSAYNLDRKTAGGGALVVVGTHFLDLMLDWFGYPDDVGYADDSRGGPEAHCEATVHYTSGGRDLHGHIRLSKTVILDYGFAMEADGGVVLYQLMTGAPLVFRPRHEPGTEVVLRPRGEDIFPRDRDEFVIQLDRFVAACRGEGKPLVDGRRGFDSVRLVHDFYKSRVPLREDWLDAIRKDKVA